MRVTATPTIPGRIDLSSLQRLQENNPIEEVVFWGSIGPNESIVIDDEYYPLTRIQEALTNGWITITEYGGGLGPPPAHGSTHEDGGSDEINVGGLSGLLADAQTPLSHASTHQNGGSDEINVAGLSGLLADAQTPLSHGTSHVNGTDDVPDFVGDSGSGGTKGLVPAPAAGDTAAGKYLKADGTWDVPPGGGGGGGTWGSITGTLSDQTDLQAALDAKADITYVDAEVECVKRYAFMIALSG
jgi:hypothetical protein